MKKIFICSIAVVMLLTLFSCAKAEKEEVKFSEIIEEMMTKYNIDGGDFFSSDFDDIDYNIDDDYLSGKYGNDGAIPPVTADIEEYAIFIHAATYNPELGIYKMKTEQAATLIKKQIEERIGYYIKYANNYPNLDTSIIHNAKVKKEGKIVYYAITSDSSKTISDMEKALFD